MPQVMPFLPDNVDVRQAGALDGLGSDEMAELAPVLGGYELITRLRDGSAITVGREQIVSLIQACIGKLEGEGANPILLMCTGEFPTLRSDALLVEPDRLLVNVVNGLRPQRIAVFVPLPSQAEATDDKWEAVEAEKVYVDASPYGEPDEIARAAAELQEPSSFDLVVMDCMGYREAHRRLVVRAMGRPAILAASLAARVVGELLQA
jgi:protein AroM